MPTKTLYVAEEDERVWEEVRGLGGDESVSKLATEGFRLLLAERRAAEEEAQHENDQKPEDAEVVKRFLRELRRVGWERAGSLFARACVDYGAARSRAKRKADETLGTEGRKDAARKAQKSKGVKGRQAAARAAWATRKANAARTERRG